MQKNSKWVYLWDVIYPVGMYLVISNIVMFLLGLVAPANNENYIVRHIIVSVVSLPFILSYYRRPPVYCIEVAEKKRIRPEAILLALAAGAAFGAGTAGAGAGAASRWSDSGDSMKSTRLDLITATWGP